MSKNIDIVLSKVVQKVIDDSIIEDDGLYWRTLTNGEGGLKKQVSLELYNGVSGISLLFLELFKNYKDNRYLEIVDKCVNWTIKNLDKYPLKKDGFYEGKLGVAFLFARYHQITGKLDYKVALDIARNCQIRPEDRVELLNGLSGQLLGYLHLHNITKAPFLLDNINEIVKLIVQRIKIGPIGIFWDYAPYSNQGMTGFSHGNAGIAYTLTQASDYLDNNNLLLLAQQARLYENMFYADSIQNWMDVRRKGTMKDFLQHLKAGNNDFFKKVGDTTAWCYGSPGIGLSRLSEWQKTNNEELWVDIDKAVAKTKQISKEKSHLGGHYNLCHGLGGNAILFIELFKEFGQDEYLLIPEKIRDEINATLNTSNFLKPGYSNIANEQESPGLFLGNAGIAYFLMQLASPETKFSILKPDVQSVCESSTLEGLEYICINEDAIRQIIFKKMFPYSSPKIVWTNLSQPETTPQGSDLKEEFSQLVTSSDIDKNLKDDFHMEMKLLTPVSSKKMFFAFVRNQYFKQTTTLNFDDNTLLCYNPDYTLKVGSKEALIVSVNNYPNVPPIVLTKLNHYICEHFLMPINIKSVLSKILEQYDVTDDQIESITAHISKLVTKLLQLNILITYLLFKKIDALHQL